MDTIISAVRNLDSFLQRELLRVGILGGVKKEVDLVRVQNVLMFLSFFKPTSQKQDLCLYVIPVFTAHRLICE